MLIAEKINQAVHLLNELETECWITFVRESEISKDPMLDYVCGSDVTWHSAFLIFRSGETVAVVGEGDRETIDAKKTYGQVIGYVRDFREPLARIVGDRQPTSIALNYSETSEVCDGLTHGMFLTLQHLLDDLGLGRRIVAAEPIISRLRGRKSPAELDRIRRAIRETLDIFAVVQPSIRPGVSERALARIMQQQVLARGLEFAWSREHCPAVFTGPDALGLHASPSDRLIEPGHLLYIDFGVKVEGYCSDLQRTFYVTDSVDRRVPPEVQRGFDTLAGAIEAARLVLRPGTRGVDVDGAARTYLVTRGYEEFPHGLGHQVGRFAHDGTALLGPAWEKYGQKVLVPVEEGMVFTIEPRLLVPGHGQVSIEEMVVVTHDGAEYLSQPQETLLVIDDPPGR